MIKHIWTVLCRESIIEAKTNNISLMDAYEQLQFDFNVDPSVVRKTEVFTGAFPFEIVSLFYRESKGTAEKFKVTGKILDPKGTELGTFFNDSEFLKEHNRVRSRVKFDTIALTTSGTYVIQVYLQRGEKHVQVSAVPLDVIVKVNGKEL